MTCQSLRTFVLAFLLLGVSGGTSSAQGSAGSPGGNPNAAWAGLPLVFAHNAGQHDAWTRYSARWGGVAAFVGDSGMRLTVMKNGPSRVVEGDTGANVRLTFDQARDGVVAKGTDLRETRFNYFLGNDPKGWFTDVATFGSIAWHEVWTGIDARLYDGGGRFEYDFVVKPGATSSDVVVRVAGCDGLAIRDDGALVIATAVGNLIQPRPKAWLLGADGTKTSVACAFRLIDEGRFGFAVEGDGARTLVIDPSIVWGGYIGGTSFDSGFGIAVNAAGNAFVCGRTASTDFPVTAGAFDTSRSGPEDAFVAKIAASGASVVWATFIGGTGLDFANVVKVDASDQVVIAGLASGSFPTPVGFDTTYNGNADAFVTKFNAAGNGIVFSTYLGSNNQDVATGLALAPTGEVTACGAVQGTGFPYQPGSFQSTPTGDWEAFACRLSAAGTALQFCARLGGAGFDTANGVAIDSTGNTYVAISTESVGVSTTAGAIQANNGGGASDVYLAKLNVAGSALVYATYLGGIGADQATGITLIGNDAVIVGQAFAGFPTTPGALQPVANNGDGFLARINATGTGLVFSTFLGGSNFDNLTGVVADANGAICAAGWTSSADFPVTPQAFMTTYVGGGSPGDAIVVKFSPDGHALSYSTLIAGDGSDQFRGLALDPAGGLYLTGVTDSTDLPVPTGGFHGTSVGQSDGIVMKIALPLGAAVTSAGVGCGVAPVFTSSVPFLGLPLTLDITGATVNAGGYLLLSGVPSAGTLVAPGCTTALDLATLSPVATFVTSGTGTWNFVSAPLPQIAELNTLTVRLQVLIVGGPAPGFTLSNALELRTGY